MVTSPTTTNTTMVSVVVTEGILNGQATWETDKDRTTANSMEITTVVKVVKAVMVALDLEDSVFKDLLAMDSMETKNKKLMGMDLNMITTHKMIPNITRDIRTTTTKDNTTMGQIALQLPDLLLTPAERTSRAINHY